MEALTKEQIMTVFVEHNITFHLLQDLLELSIKQPMEFELFAEDLKGILHGINGYGSIYENCDYISFFQFLDHEEKPGEVAELQYMVKQNKDDKGNITSYELSDCVTAYIVGKDIDNDYEEYELDYYKVMSVMMREKCVVEALQKIKNTVDKMR